MSAAWQSAFRVALIAATLAPVACGGAGAANPPNGGKGPVKAHSSTIAIAPGGDALYVVNADADSVSAIDLEARTLKQEILLGGAHPALDASGNYLPAILPRALALSSDGKTLYVSGERSGKLYVVDVASGRVTGSVSVGSEPIGVLLSADDSVALVACSQDATVVRVDTASLAVTGSASTPNKPWSLAWSPDGTKVLTTHLLGPGVSQIDPGAMTLDATWTIPDAPPRGDKRLAHGQPRGIYDVEARPASDELWVIHSLLGTDTAQPSLDFESTIFPGLSVFHSTGDYEETMYTSSADAAQMFGVNGAIADIVSGPHGVEFTHDGKFALVVDTNSEDVLAMDANQRIEATLLRPIPGHQPEGIAISPDDQTAYVDERTSGDVLVVKLDSAAGPLTLAIDGKPIPRFAKDPMPAELRLGQHLFYSANSDEYPLTKNHWVACASCHMEGRSDAVTWKFAQGPRDTPSNAGGTLGTGFLFRTADRNKVQDYFMTINVEQGGHFSATDPLLNAIEAYVDHAIPFPVPPNTDPTLVAKGKEIFNRTEVGCSGCHSGPHFTDSGTGNPKLDLAGPILLHDVGTCVTTPYPDVAHLDIEGHKRAACEFDTPSLIGVSDSAPYLHDGSAATLLDVLEQTRGHMGDISSLSSDDLNALVEYLRSL